MRMTKEEVEKDFVCPKCHGHGAVTQEVSIGRGMTHMLPLAINRYLAVSCGLCGYTEFYMLAVVEKEPETDEVPAMAKLAERPK